MRPCLGQDRELIVVGKLEPLQRKALEQRIAATHQPGQFVAQYPVAPLAQSGNGMAEALDTSTVVLR